MSTSPKFKTRTWRYHQVYARPYMMTSEYFIIFGSSIKLAFQRFKRGPIWRLLQGDMAKTLDVTELKSVLDRIQCWSKSSIIPSFRIEFQCISTRWKDNFMSYPVDLLFEIFSVQDQSKNPRRIGWTTTMVTTKGRSWWQQQGIQIGQWLYGGFMNNFRG